MAAVICGWAFLGLLQLWRVRRQGPVAADGASIKTA